MGEYKYVGLTFLGEYKYVGLTFLGEYKYVGAKHSYRDRDTRLELAIKVVSLDRSWSVGLTDDIKKNLEVFLYIFN